MRCNTNTLYDSTSQINGIKYSLFDLASWKNGLAFKNINFSDSGIPVIKISELNNGIGSTTKYTNQKFSDDIHLLKNDLVFSWSGNPETSIDIFRFQLEEGWLNQHIFKVVPNQQIIDKDYFYFLMKWLKPRFIQIACNKQTIGLGHITITDIKYVKVILPDMNTQKKIASFLKSIDDLIIANQQINHNLEEQAKAIFKSWFIDYDEYNGKIPKTWQQGALGDFIEIKRGSSPRPIQNYLSDKGLRWLKISDATSISSPFISRIKEFIKEDGLKQTVFLKAGSLILSNSATPGVPKILDIDACIHDGWLYFPKSVFSNEYLYLYFKHIREKLLRLGNGSVFTNLKIDILKNYETILPTDEVLNKFNTYVKPVFAQIRKNTAEISTLTTLRDTLLPKLMSGEIDVSAVEIGR